MNTVKYQRQQRVRSKGKQVANRPRLSVNLSLRYLSAQIINDQQRVTVAAVHEKQVADVAKPERLAALAQALAKQATAKGIKLVWFDRGARAYHGRLAAFADKIRAAGLEF